MKRLRGKWPCTSKGEKPEMDLSPHSRQKESTLNFRLCPLKVGDNIFLFFKPPGLWSFVTAAYRGKQGRTPAISRGSENVKSLSHVWLLVTPWTVAHQAPLSMGLSRQEYWSELPCPPPAPLRPWQKGQGFCQGHGP